MSQPPAQPPIPAGAMPLPEGVDKQSLEARVTGIHYVDPATLPKDDGRETARENFRRQLRARCAFIAIKLDAAVDEVTKQLVAADLGELMDMHDDLIIDAALSAAFAALEIVCSSPRRRIAARLSLPRVNRMPEAHVYAGFHLINNIKVWRRLFAQGTRTVEDAIERAQHERAQSSTDSNVPPQSRKEVDAPIIVDARQANDGSGTLRPQDAGSLK